MTEPHKKDVGTIRYWLRRQLPDHIVNDLNIISKDDDSFEIRSKEVSPYSGSNFYATVSFYCICRGGENGGEEFYIPYFNFVQHHNNGNQTNFWIGQWAQMILGGGP